MESTPVCFGRRARFAPMLIERQSRTFPIEPRARRSLGGNE
jgi:hypothetical protein